MIRLTCSKCGVTAYGNGNSGLCASCAGLSQTIELDGLVVVVCRSSLDGALMIDVDSSDLERDDVHLGGHEVPRLRLAINDHTEQLDKDGNWVESTPYPPLTVLDHIVEATS